jgi:hypothetical protein
LSARDVVEREKICAFNKSPKKELPIKINIVGAVQQKKMIQFPKKSEESAL